MLGEALAAMEKNRRHMTKGALAMVRAVNHAEPTKLKRKGYGSSETEQQIHKGYLAYARTVLREAPDLVPGRVSTNLQRATFRDTLLARWLNHSSTRGLKPTFGRAAKPEFSRLMPSDCGCSWRPSMRR